MASYVDCLKPEFTEEEIRNELAQFGINDVDQSSLRQFQEELQNLVKEMISSSQQNANISTTAKTSSNNAPSSSLSLLTPFTITSPSLMIPTDKKSTEQPSSVTVSYNQPRPHIQRTTENTEYTLRLLNGVDRVDGDSEKTTCRHNTHRFNCHRHADKKKNLKSRKTSFIHSTEKNIPQLDQFKSFDDLLNKENVRPRQVVPSSLSSVSVSKTSQVAAANHMINTYTNATNITTNIYTTATNNTSNTYTTAATTTNTYASTTINTYTASNIATANTLTGATNTGKNTASIASNTITTKTSNAATNTAATNTTATNTNTINSSNAATSTNNSNTNNNNTTTAATNNTITSTAAATITTTTISESNIAAINKPISLVNNSVTKRKISRKGIDGKCYIDESESISSISSSSNSINSCFSSTLQSAEYQNYLREMTNKERLFYQRAIASSDSRPKSTIITAPKQPKLKKNNKSDPVKRFHEFRVYWNLHKVPGENKHSALRWSIREKIAKRDVIESRPRKKIVSNNYEIPSQKQRQSLRWQIRTDLAYATCQF